MRFRTRSTFKSVQTQLDSATILGWCANGNNDAVGACLLDDIPEQELYFQPKHSRHSLWNMLKALPNQHDFKNDHFFLVLLVSLGCPF